MSEVKITNIPQRSTGAVVDELASAYITVLRSGLPANTMPSVMLWGPPGIGKSQAVRQIGDKIGGALGLCVHITDLRLATTKITTLEGIPTSNADKTKTVWLEPEFLADMDRREGHLNILFLDEISAAPPSIQAAAYQITLDRVIGQHKLPENCIVFAAGNRTTDKSVAYKMPKALANRLLHIEVEGSFKAWKKWAIGHGVNEKVTGFLTFRQNYLMQFDPANEDLAFATPRSWEKVSDLLNHVNSDVDKVYTFVAGLIGTGIASEFRTWVKVYDSLPSLDDIFGGKSPAVPKSTDALYALISSMTAYASDHRDDMKAIANSVVYANRMPPDFSSVLLRDYMYIEDGYKEKLLKIPEFHKWLTTKGRLMNGSV